MKKNQWFKFSDGQYEAIDKEDALRNYFPYMVFYKQINRRNTYFSFSGYAHLPTMNVQPTPHSKQDDGWGIIENLGNSESKFEELQELREQLEKEK